MAGRFVWWRTGLADEDPTLAAAPDLAVTAAPAAGAAEATGAGAPEVAPDPTPDLVPIATSDVIIPAPDLEGSLVPSREKENLILAITGHALGPVNPNLIQAPTSPDHVLQTENPSHVQRAALR